jgi:hypothetical protein
MSHPIHSTNEDVCCRWLCESAGRRTTSDNNAIADAIEALPFRGHALHLRPCPLSEVK